VGDEDAAARRIEDAVVEGAAGRARNLITPAVFNDMMMTSCRCLIVRA
jgi:hypothetical protein